jgi:hypothetical protein
MAAVKVKLGRIPCDCCGHLVLLKQNEAGTLTMQCDECDVSAFAKKGTAAAMRWRAKLPKEQAEGLDPAPVAAPIPQAPESVPKAPAPKATAFDYLLGLGAKGA